MNDLASIIIYKSRSFSAVMRHGLNGVCRWCVTIFAIVQKTIISNTVFSTPALPPRPPTVTTASLTLRHVTLPELSHAMRDLSSSKAVAHDGIPLHVIRQCFAVIGPHILHLCNASILTCTFPSSWKLASVVPIHKAGKLDAAENFRPISILPAM